MPQRAPTLSSLRPKVRRFESRPSSYDRGYDGKWKKFSRWFLSKNPLCLDCRLAGYVMPSSEVHHIIPLAQRPDLKYAEDNLEPLCHTCHNKKTGREKSRIHKNDLENILTGRA